MPHDRWAPPPSLKFRRAGANHENEATYTRILRIIFNLF
jgi:hypothetical protein